jgi:protein TonB
LSPARGHLVPAATVAVLLHGAALGWLALVPPPPPPSVRLPPAKVRLVGRTPPAPEPRPPEPVRAPEPAPKAPLRPEPARVARVEPIAPAPQAAPPPLPAPRRFAVSIEATVPGGGVAVPVTQGPTAARGRADLPASAPVGDNEGPTALDVVEVERAPRAVRQPTAADLRALYPEQARREGQEADVRLELLVDATGRVAQVKLVRGAGDGFDEAAARAAGGIEFEPARRGGRPVAVWIPWTLKFRLEG